MDWKRTQRPVAVGRATHLEPAFTASNFSPKSSYATQQGWRGPECPVRGRSRREIVDPADPANSLRFPTQKFHFCPSPECRAGVEGSQSGQANMVRDRQRDHPFPCVGPPSVKYLCEALMVQVVLGYAAPTSRGLVHRDETEWLTLGVCSP